MKSIEKDIIVAHSQHNNEQIRSIYLELMNSRAKLDRWFNKYLDMFDDKLTHCDRNDPVKKMYNLKYDEYEQINRVIKIAEHYMNKANYV